MAECISWDIDDIRAHKRELANRKNSLEGQKSFLENINSKVETAWQGIAGAAFDDRMDVDIRNFRQILDELQALIDDLGKAEGKYEACEQNIRNEIRNLRNKI